MRQGDDKKLSSLGTEIPWGHNRRIMTLKSSEEIFNKEL